METKHEPVLTRVPVLGHSLHRWLVGIPVILYAATVGFFALYAQDDNLMWLRDAFVANLLGVVAAVIVAIPGALDLRAIPEAHPARATALAHASLMAVVLALFATNLAMHIRPLSAALKGSMVLERGFDATVPLLLTGTALTLGVCGAALGVVLAHRHHVGDTIPEEMRHTVRPRFR